MSATNRMVEAEVLTADIEDSKKARAKFEADLAAIAAEQAVDLDVVRKILTAARARRTKKKRSKGDFYETPAWCVDAILPFLPITGEPVVVDAGAGTGAIAARLSAINPRAEIVGFEKQQELVDKARARGLLNAEFRHANFLNDELSLMRAPELVIMNPPFGMAQQFVQRALQIVKRGGTVCALLRLNWLGSKSRREFLKKHLPSFRVLTKRPSFTGKGTDATEYAWFLWGPEGGGTFGLLTHDDKSKRRPRAPRKTSPKKEA